MRQTVNPFFDVAREPAYADFNGERISLNRDALLNAENSNVLGIVARNYRVVPNREVASVFEEAFRTIPVSFVHDHLSGNEALWQRDIVLDGEEYTHVIGNDDVIQTCVYAYNGYTGTNGLGFGIRAWRRRSASGLMGWRRIYGMNLTHVSADTVERIREGFADAFIQFASNFRIWDEWNRQPMTQDQFNQFVVDRIKTEENEHGYLSVKQAEEICDLYLPVKNEFGEQETRWGAYNVLAAIANHHTNARKGSNIYSAAYKRMERLTKDFFDASLFLI